MQQCPDRAGTGLCRLQRHQGLQWSGSKTIKRGPLLLVVPARSTLYLAIRFNFTSNFSDVSILRCNIVITNNIISYYFYDFSLSNVLVDTFETGTQRAWYYYDSVLTTEPVQQCTIVQRDWTREH
ncbi:hypothetical protein V1478_003865 [Vespula squamosa]|uniref:Uncharacterized protein n=1 Tax=Vespula squamosa TaxID=30214 RepID=A0ABD2BN34_VESSQ